MDDLTLMALDDLLARWVPGSADWSWADELADLHASPVTDAIRARVVDEGIGFADHFGPVLLGSDGRVWDGHHRICIAMELGITHLMVEVAGD